MCVWEMATNLGSVEEEKFSGNNEQLLANSVGYCTHFDVFSVDRSAQSVAQ